MFFISPIQGPPCEICGDEMTLTRRTPDPDKGGFWESRTYTCICEACSHTIVRRELAKVRAGARMVPPG